MGRMSTLDDVLLQGGLNMRRYLTLIIVIFLVSINSGCALYRHCESIVRNDRMSNQQLDQLGVAMHPEQRLAYGIRLERSGELDKAEAQYLKVLDEEYRMEEALFNLGNVYVAKSEKSLRPHKWQTKAVDCYQQALGINPDNMVAANNLADVLNEQGKPDDAIDLLTRFVDKNIPDSEYLYATLGDAKKRLGEYEESVAAYVESEKEALKETDIDRKFLSGLYKSRSHVHHLLSDEINADLYRNKAKKVLERKDDNF